MMNDETVAIYKCKSSDGRGGEGLIYYGFECGKGDEVLSTEWLEREYIIGIVSRCDEFNTINDLLTYCVSRYDYYKTLDTYVY